MENKNNEKAFLKIICKSYSIDEFQKISHFYEYIGSQKLKCHEHKNLCFYKNIYKRSSFLYLQFEMTREQYNNLPLFISVDFKKNNS